MMGCKMITISPPKLTQEEKDKFLAYLDFYLYQIYDRTKLLPEGKLKSEFNTIANGIKTLKDVMEK
jgi:hypothetical protein